MTNSIEATAPDFSNLPNKPNHVAISISCTFDTSTGKLEHGKFMLDVELVNADGEEVKPTPYEENFVIRGVLSNLLSAIDKELNND